jgi:hypothetical protein
MKTKANEGISAWYFLLRAGDHVSRSEWDWYTKVYAAETLYQLAAAIGHRGEKWLPVTLDEAVREEWYR